MLHGWPRGETGLFTGSFSVPRKSILAMELLALDPLSKNGFHAKEVGMAVKGKRKKGDLSADVVVADFGRGFESGEALEEGQGDVTCGAVSLFGDQKVHLHDLPLRP